MILAISTRTQVALAMGVIGFIAIKFVGFYILKDFEIPELLSGLTKPLLQYFQTRYDDAAWGCLLGFWALAFKFYRKDSKRFDKLFF
jgi:hypothetical protein